MQPHRPTLAPRNYTPGAGSAHARSARIAARQGFVALKQGFLEALDNAPEAEWLRQQVRAAEAPVDLWLLRAPVFAVLGLTADGHSHRQRLRCALDSAFPDLDAGGACLPF